MLHSDWLLNMLDKTGHTPRERVLALFDILQDWTTAPGLQHGDDTVRWTGTADALLRYLTQQLTALQLEAPDSLAAQIYFLALGALRSAAVDERTLAFAQARQAAAILLDAQRAQRAPRRLTVGMAAIAASAFVLIATLWLVAYHQPAHRMTPLATAADIVPSTPTLAGNSPDQVVALHASLERLRSGVCQYPQALMLAPEARAVLLENVVQGAMPADADQLRTTRLLIQKVECYYPPVAMTAL